MPSQHYEIIGLKDKHRAFVGSSGTLMLSRWPDEGLPDGLYFMVEGAPVAAMQAVADAINAAIDAARSATAPVDLREVA